ncbi:Gfo/Idh/MocA family protein [Roseimaritima ulvae]|uniref:UDP-N-acetyl-2-amino-2-deoxy-D-glucuronate oxidase n=1 Tax=Roseimaritima ulvae TaxID=980254 RepID=A0A5B9QXF6_9BACT|nr:Gfo/Idh/MocA family oxidoreductase [Roseimaritima ulvae]QEG38643.1 UDP-N-acetyl-2-amino-2-deoxy-D-glucuronate oxidase [Roseimaritima ulvae]
MTQQFALIGAAGFVAPKHMKAIRDTGNELIAAMDRNDSVGVIDSYAPEAAFFTEFERFDRFLEKRRREQGGEAIDYLAICSPNYLHDAHCRLALRVGAHAICEKPLVINPWNLDQLRELEQEYGKKVYSVLQLRLHPEVIALKEQVEASQRSDHEIELTYITRRGRWYHQSWKGNPELSGGLGMNIGVHFFDFLLWIFGSVQRSYLHLSQPDKLSGVLHLEKARIKWFLSIDHHDLPDEVQAAGGYAHRAIRVDGNEVDLSKGFTDLHTEVYRNILAGGGHGIDEAQRAIELIYQIRTSQTVPTGGAAHPFLSPKQSLRV